MLKINPIGRFAAVLLFFTVMGCIGLAAENVHLEYYKDLYTKKSQEGQPAWLDDYPPATTCKECHPVHYRQWSVSPHAYAQMSPVFNAMQATLFQVTNGSNGDFCIRCHTPVGMNLGEPEFMSNIDRHPTSREGITCIACHRVNKNYGKISGRLALDKGNLVDVPVSTPNPKDRLDALIDEHNLSTDIESESGTKVHAEATFFEPLGESAFCGTCHDVLLHNGFRLEEAFSEYKRSPAAKKGISCQDCHMGIEHGAFSGDKETNYAEAPIAVVNGKETPPRKITNHMFAGPDHSVIHPGIFPHNDEAVRDVAEDEATSKGLATIREWLSFDHEAGWGSKDFEKGEWKKKKTGEQLTPFPERWETRAERRKARRILDQQVELIDEYMEARGEVLRNGFKLGEVEVTRASPRRGLHFQVEVLNATDGHGVPTGFIGERTMFLRVTVKDPDGEVVFLSGDLDPNGDYRDSHSLYVHNHELPLDKQLFTLQSRFLVTTVRGGEREVVLPVPFSLTPLPYINPQANASTLTGRPDTARIHKNNIMPGNRRVAKYRVAPDQLTGSGTYTATVQFVVGMVPINLLDAIKGVGFDYDLSAKEIADRVIEGHTIIAEETFEIDL